MNEPIHEDRKLTSDPAVGSTVLLAAIPSGELECEMVRRRIDQARTQIAAAELALAHMRRKQAAREAELARQLVRIAAND